MSRILLGLDLDNTIVCYDAVFRELAAAGGYLEVTEGLSRREIRDRLRAHPEGERTWQVLQGQAYGRGMAAAAPFPGVGAFLGACRAAGVTVCVVSHKTRFGHHDAARVPLRETAMAWLEARGLVGPQAPLGRGDVYFEATRAEKVARIRALGCTHFVDDLEETFAEAGFPEGTERILFDPGRLPGSSPSLRVVASWDGLAAYLLGPRSPAATPGGA